MKNLILLSFCAVVVLLQLSAEGVVFSGQRIPDLALALAITLVVTMGFEKSIGWIVLIGLLIDAGSNPVFGTTALAYLLTGWGISCLVTVADIRSRKILFLLSLAAFTVFSEVAKDFLVLGSLKIKAHYFKEAFSVSGNFFSLDYALKILYTILAMYFVYYIFKRIRGMLFYEPVKLAKRY